MDNYRELKIRCDPGFGHLQSFSLNFIVNINFNIAELCPILFCLCESNAFHNRLVQAEIMVNGERLMINDSFLRF